MKLLIDKLDTTESNKTNRLALLFLPPGLKKDKSEDFAEAFSDMLFNQRDKSRASSEVKNRKFPCL
jgi:hypothetical protein